MGNWTSRPKSNISMGQIGIHPVFMGHFPLLDLEDMVKHQLLKQIFREFFRRGDHFSEVQILKRHNIQFTFYWFNPIQSTLQISIPAKVCQIQQLSIYSFYIYIYIILYLPVEPRTYEIVGSLDFSFARYLNAIPCCPSLASRLWPALQQGLQRTHLIAAGRGRSSEAEAGCGQQAETPGLQVGTAYT
jgi:hypothetical protein